MCAALSAAELGANVIVLSKGGIDETNTRYAQGGLAAAIGEDDTIQAHAGDTLSVGCDLSEVSVVDAIIGGGPDAVAWLLKLGFAVDRDEHGKVSLRREGGHRIARILHSGGTATGRELQRALGAQISNNPCIHVLEHTTAVDLLKNADGTVSGLVALMGEGRGAVPVKFEAGAVVLATGGGGQLFRETTNPALATADGLAMALRSGAQVQDLEFVQFHPTILYLAGAARFLISEVTRGAGAILRNRHGVVFMGDAHADAELAPRDVVSREIFRQMLKTGDTHVYLDFSKMDNPTAKFPKLAQITKSFGIDLAREGVPVRPAVHYFIGGVAATLEGRTSLPGLWATGECASTGFHGANRMGSNSLLEGVVHGRLVGADVARASRDCDPRPLMPICGRYCQSEPVELNLTDLTYSLKSLLWRQAGIERDASGLADALMRIDQWEGYLERMAPFTRQGVEAVNMLQVSRALVLAAAFRRESRGAHFRADFPQRESDWLCHSRLSCGPEGIWLRTNPSGLQLTSNS